MTEPQTTASHAKSSVNDSIPTVSIGMPVYNGAKYIREALDSLLAQTFTDFELIISDNNSTDATELICREYAANDSRIKYLRQPVNRGAAANFKIVLDQACGTHFMWAACDDKWDSDWLECLYKKIKASGAGMAFGKVAHIDAAGKLKSHPANDASFCYTGCTLSRRIKFYLAHEALGKANTIHSLYSRKLIEPLNVMLSEMIDGKCIYDYTIVYSCLKHQILEKENKVTIYKRVHMASVSFKSETDANSLSWKLKKFSGKVWPFLPGLIGDYIKYSSIIEKILIILLLPVKLLGAYLFGMRQIIARLRRMG